MPHRPSRYGRRPVKEERDLAERVCKYRVMWVIVCFDLPMDTPVFRKIYAKFRKQLLQSGFHMHQFSMYVRHCSSFENAEVHIQRVERIIPAYGHISIMMMTDKQFGMIRNFWGYGRKPPKTGPQLTMLFDEPPDKPPDDELRALAENPQLALPAHLPAEDDVYEVDEEDEEDDE